MIHFAHDQLVIGHIRSSSQIVLVFYDGAHSKRYESPSDQILAKSVVQLIPNLTSAKKVNRNLNQNKKETDKS